MESANKFILSFQKNRNLVIKDKKPSSITSNDLVNIVRLCIRQQPINLEISLKYIFVFIKCHRFNQIEDISPFNGMGGLHALNRMKLNLQ